MPRPTKNRPSKSGSSFLKAFWAAGVWAIIILILTGMPGQDLPNIDIWDIDIEDKLAHVFVFAVLSGLMVYGAWKRGTHTRRRLRLALSIVIISSLYGALTEVLQGAVFVGRYPSITDFLADAVGSIVGTVLVFFWLSKRQSS